VTNREHRATVTRSFPKCAAAVRILDKPPKTSRHALLVRTVENESGLPVQHDTLDTADSGA
jgi:hypothetical protein